MKYIKQISIGVALTTVLIGGAMVIGVDEASAPVVTPGDYTIEIEDSGKAFEVLRITPDRPLDFFGERSFTLNDIISEMEFEHRVNGDSNRYLELTDLKERVDAQVKTLPAREI